MSIYSQKSMLVLGLGETGLSMVKWLIQQGVTLRVADSRNLPPALNEIKKYVQSSQIFCGEFTDALFEGIDLVAISPGVALADPAVSRAIARGVPVIGDIELFAQSLPIINRPKVIAITGSNGKSTVTSLVEHMCKMAGMDAVAAGNISPAVLDVVMERGIKQPQVWVLELSSFQLESTMNLCADCATVLNVSEDHLDRYCSMQAYSAAKARILEGSCVQVLNREDLRTMQMAHEGLKTMTFGLNSPTLDTDFGVVRHAQEIRLMQGSQFLMNASELLINGLHNVANVLAAFALCRAIEIPMETLIAAARCFKGLPHRVELVSKLGSVTYFDDSKGTNVGATIAALAGLECKSVLIAGGDGKGQDFSPLNEAVAQYARAVVLIGRDANLIATALQGARVRVVFATDMFEAVRLASQLACEGDAVLLSPACASFDMFRNYEHRAEVFIRAVNLQSTINPSSDSALGINRRDENEGAHGLAN